MKDKKVIIVASSPHLEGKGTGKLIDSYDIVVRMNQGYRLMKLLPQDYGSKIDMLFLCGWSAQRLSGEFLHKNYQIPPSKVYLKYKDFREKPHPKYKIPKSTNHNQGIITIFSLLEMGYTNITLTGYSFYQTDYKYPKEYLSFSPESPDYNNKQNLENFKGKIGHNQVHTVLNLQYFIENHNIKLLEDTRYYYDKFLKELNLK